jgi:hypothetical protein
MDAPHMRYIHAALRARVVPNGWSSTQASAARANAWCTCTGRIPLPGVRASLLHPCGADAVDCGLFEYACLMSTIVDARDVTQVKAVQQYRLGQHKGSDAFVVTACMRT